MSTPFQLLDGHQALALDASVSGERVSIDAASLERGLGWKLRPEGLCRGRLCVPVRDRDALAGPAGIDLAALAAALGTPAAERRAALASLEAPDFTLPDLSGRLHSLSEQRGKKVLLIAYA